MRDVLLICPTARDLAAVRDAGLDARYRTHAVGADADALDDFDPVALLREAELPPADGVVASKDRGALLAALVAERRGLPGPSPRAVLRCQHKLASRRLQRLAVSGAVPAFAAVGGRIGFDPPYFVKPVIGRLSQGARRVDDAAELPGPLHDRYRASVAAMAELAGWQGLDVHGHLAEELLHGREVTLEGYVHRGRVVVVGVTDSVCYPGTDSFQRFEYPSALPAERLDELGGVAARLLPALGFDTGFFNVEFVVPEDGPAALVEVNARVASQFAPLVLAVHGRSTYDALYALACGDDPAWDGGAADGVAVSWVVRVFEDAFVDSVPEPEPGVELLVGPGRRLSEQGVNDVRSYRLAIFWEHAATRAEAVRRCEARAERLLAGFGLSSRGAAYTVAHGT